MRQVMRPYRRKQRGAALFVALAVVVIVLAAVLTVNGRVQRALATAAVQADGTYLDQAAAGGVHTAIALLLRDRETSQADHLLEDWAVPEKIDPMAAAGLPADIDLKVRVTDIRSLIQVNALVVFPAGREFAPKQQALWQRLLGLKDFSEMREAEQTPIMIVNSLKDWLDHGDDGAVTGLSGAEAAHYADLPVPYACRNGPLRSIDELLLVHGITPSLYRGSDELPGLASLVTIFGAKQVKAERTYDGRININTAPPPVLAALLPEAHQDLAAAIFEYRQEMAADDERWPKPLWYRDAPGCQDLSIDTDLITTASDLFRIQATAVRQQQTATVTAVVQRLAEADGGKVTHRILSWQPS